MSGEVSPTLLEKREREEGGTKEGKEPKIEKGGFILTHDTSDTFLGLGKFEPEPEYGLTNTVDGNLRKQRSLRDCCFIFIPVERRVIFFKNKLGEDQVRAEEKKQKVLLALEKQVKFNILPGKNVAFFVDTPTFNPMFDSRYHQDAPPSLYLPDNIRTVLRAITRDPINPSSDFYSNYVLIEYRDVCISTTVQNPLNDNDVLRFTVCPGEVLCLENKRQLHTSPYVLQDEPGLPSRKPGNKLLEEAGVRSLYRTQVVEVTPSSLQSIVASGLLEGKDYDIITLSEEELRPIISQQPFESMTLQDYLSRPRHQEAGKRKSRRKRKQRQTRKKRKTKRRRRRGQAIL